MLCVEEPATEFHDLKKARDSSLIITKAVLLVVSPNYFGDTFIISKNKHTIVRGGDDDFDINDSQISKNHLLITFNDSKYYVEDLQSSNGTLLNGKLLKKKVQLFYGDKIVMGSTIMRLYFEEKSK